MKKILYSLLIFASIVFVSTKVSAAKYTYPVMNIFLNYDDETHDLSKDFNEILSIADDHNYNLMIVLDYHMMDDGSFCYSKPDGTKCEYIEQYYVYLLKNNYVPTFKIGDSGTLYSSINSNIVLKTIVVDANYSSSYATLINELNNEDFSNFVSTRKSTGTGNQHYLFMDNNHEMIYGSSMDYKISSLSSSNTYFFGENQLSVGGLLPTYKNYYYVEDEPEPNIFDEEIDDIDYSKMIFEFDVAFLKERNNLFDYLIDFENLGIIRDDNTLDTSRVQKFSRPYLEYVDSNGITRNRIIDFGYENQLEPRSAWYVAQTEEMPSNIKSLKLILPMEQTLYSRYKVSLVSYIPVPYNHPQIFAPTPKSGV